MCDVPTTTIVICVQLVHKSLVAHGSNPQHSKRQPNYDCLVVFIIFMRTHPNPLLSKTQLVNDGYENPTFSTLYLYYRRFIAGSTHVSRIIN